MEKAQLINFIVKVLEESGFKAYKYFKTSQHTIDIYAIFPTTMGEFTMVMACKNYEKDKTVDVKELKEIEEIGKSLQAAKVAFVTSSYFSNHAKNYANHKKIKLVDRENLLELAKEYSEKTKNNQENQEINYENSENNYDDGLLVENQPQLVPFEYKMGYKKEDIYRAPSLSKYSTSEYSNSLYPYRENKSFFQKITNKFKRKPKNQLYLRNSYYNYYKPEPAWKTIAKKLLNNAIFLIILVIAITYLISYIVGVLAKQSSAITGLIQLFVSLILSYGLVFFFNKDRDYTLIKGTIVFFTSLLILTLSIIVL